MWVYNVSDNTWTAVTYDTGEPFPAARYGHTVTRLDNNKVLIYGGRTSAGTVLSDSWLFDASDSTWEAVNKTGTRPPGLRDARISYAGNGVAVLFGGVDFAGAETRQTWLYERAARSWTRYNNVATDAEGADVPIARFGHSMANRGDDHIFLFGGIDAEGDYLFDSWELDLTPLASDDEDTSTK